jgi:hypothetical protein
MFHFFRIDLKMVEWPKHVLDPLERVDLNHGARIPNNGRSPETQ